MLHDLNQHLPKPRKRPGVRLRAAGHPHPANDNCKPTVSFQYLQGDSHDRRLLDNGCAVVGPRNRALVMIGAEEGRKFRH